MASSYYKLEIKNRTDIRSKGSKIVRRNGHVPGVLYYAGEDNVNISIEKSILFQAMQSGQRIFEIDYAGEKQYTMIKQVQYHPVTDVILHFDLMRVRRSEKMTIAVPLVLVGDAIGVKEGGILSQSLTQVDISCFPTDVPEYIELNIEDLELNSAKSVADLESGNEDVEIISDSSLNVVSITPPVAEEEIIEDDLDEEMVDGEAIDDSEDNEKGGSESTHPSKQEGDNSPDDKSKES